MTLRTLRYYGEYLALRLLVALFSLMPIETASAIGGRIGRYFGTRSGKNKRAMRNLDLVFGETKPPEERARISAEMWDMLGRIFVETLLLKRLMREHDRFEMTAGHLASEIKNDGKGAVFVGAHYGNWEVAMLPPTCYGQKPVGIYRKINNPFVDRYLHGVRSQMYPGGLLLKDGVSAPKLIQMIKDGAHVGILCDQRERRGIVTSFLGVPGPTMVLPALLAHRLKVPLVAGRVIRRPGVRFRFECVTIDVARTGVLKDDLRTTTERINALFERWIHEYPEQWMWTHRRWDLVEYARAREREREIWDEERRVKTEADADARTVVAARQ